MQVYGHRGAMAYKPENTISSVQEALRQEVDMVEIDVYALPSGEIVVIHDDDVARTTNGSGAVMEMSFDHLRTLDAGEGEKIPTLDEVIDAIGGKIPLNIELKGPNTAEPTAAAIKRYISDKGLTQNDFLVSSFDHTELSKFHGLLPEITLSALFDEIPDDFNVIAKQVGASIISPRSTNVTREIVEKANESNLDVTAWTVNDAEEARRLAAIGLKGVFSNNPDLIKNALNS